MGHGNAQVGDERSEITRNGCLEVSGLRAVIHERQGHSKYSQKLWSP